MGRTYGDLHTLVLFGFIETPSLRHVTSCHFCPSNTRVLSENPHYVLLAAVLQEEGQPMAAIPHLVGILCGHVYHFFTVVHPLMGAKRRLGAPGWMKRRLDGGDNPNFMESPGDGQ